MTPVVLRRIRRIAIGVWVVIALAQIVTTGIPFDRFRSLSWAIVTVIVFSIGRRAIWTVLIDFLPLAAVFVAWDYLRGAATSFDMPTLWRPQIDLDRAVFGVEPTVWLQAHFRYPTPRWWDAPVSIVYLSFFVLPITVAVVLWLRGRRDFYRWMARYVTLSFLAFACFAVLPAAPPWAAARCTAAQVADRPTDPPCIHHSAARTDGGLLGRLPTTHDPAHPYVERTSVSGLEVLHLKRARRLVDDGAANVDLVAGVPSLHAGVSMLVVLFLWPRVRRRRRVLLAAYPIAMGLTLMYTGDHYLFDILAGWLAAGLVSVVATRIERRRRPDDARDLVEVMPEGSTAGAPV